MRRFDTVASDLDGVFKAGLTSGFADKVLDTFSMRRASASTARAGLLIA
jgi:hypothetical protein